MRRTRLYVTLGVLAGVGLLVTGAVAIMAQPGPGGGGRGAVGNRPRFGLQLMYLDRVWSAVSFELGATDEQLLALRPTFQAAADTRRQALQEARAGNADMGALALSMGQVAQQIRADIDAALAETLTEEQLEKWEELKAQPMMGLGFGMGGFGRGAVGGALPQ
ncbi:MAG: hypothetical protein ACUVX8_02565 [Candidatus Zipacnadales bacterium]